MQPRRRSWATKPALSFSLPVSVMTNHYRLLTWAALNGGGVSVENITEEDDTEPTFRLVTTYGVLEEQHEVLAITYTPRSPGIPAFLRALNEASQFVLDTLEVSDTPFDELPYIQQAQALSLKINSSHLN